MSAILNEPKPPFPAHHMTEPGLQSEMSPAPKTAAHDYKGSGKLSGQVALITGGDSGIGRAVAVLFAREGADVAIVHLPQEASDAQQTADLVQREGRSCLTIAGDVTSPEFCADAVEQTVSKFGGLNCLVNNAAYQKHRPGLEEVDFEQWDRTFKTNIYGYFFMVKAAHRHLKKSQGTVINTGSIAGLEGSKNLLDYSATKGAIHAFTKSLAQNLVKDGIRVNCVAPGPVWTPLNPAERPPEDSKDFGEGVPYGRPAQPEEIAPAYVFFASAADSSYVTGEVLRLLGGGTAAG